MFLELAETLDCPACRSGFGLVAFVDEAAGRRVVAGRLGCPLCEIEYPIRGGTIDFDPSSSSSSSSVPSLETDSSAPEPPPDAALRIASLLGLTDRRGLVVLLGPGLSVHAIEVARMGDRVEVLAWQESEVEPAPPSQDELSAGVDPIRGLSSGSWPVRSGSLHGIALLGPLGSHLPEAERCVRMGGRLVGLNPGSADIASLASSGFGELASDDLTWVGERR